MSHAEGSSRRPLSNVLVATDLSTGSELALRGARSHPGLLFSGQRTELVRRGRHPAAAMLISRNYEQQ